METTASSSPKSKNNALYDPIRGKWVAATPEEKIRRHLISHMTERLGYPVQWVAVEKELAHLPYSSSASAKRRADIIVFAPHTLSPLLLIECKATRLNESFIQQVIGYNAFVQAPFIALANGKEVITGHYNHELGQYSFEPGLPHFADLFTARARDVNPTKGAQEQ